jgi:glycolate oxidase iron-sulfur subunit
MIATLQDLEYATLQQCMHCGMCLPTCPTYDATKRERNSPRGRIALMRAVVDERLTVNREFADEMSYCLGCLACQTACPAGVKYGVLLEAARATIEKSAVASSPRRTFFRTLGLELLFTRPRVLRGVGAVLRLYQQSGLEALARRTGLTRVLPEDVRRLERQTPRMARRFSNALIAPVEQPREFAHRVALLTGCVQDLVFSDVNRDTVDVLLANGCLVETPPVQPCCGSLHAHNGEPEMAARLARALIDLLPPERFDAIISNAGGCGSHLRSYGPLLGGDPKYAARARSWDAKVRDIHEWLVEIGVRSPAAPPFDRPVAVTYHESCHLTHGQRVTRQPRDVLRAIPGVTLVELPEATWCCGSAGVYNITQPEQSERLLDRKVRNVLGTNAAIVASANPGCTLQIARGLGGAGSTIEVWHPVSLLARAYRREGSSSA